MLMDMVRFPWQTVPSIWRRVWVLSFALLSGISASYADENTERVPKKMLAGRDFRYLGRVNVVGMGWATSGLAHRPDTDTWFTVEKTGQPPYGLFEFKVPEPALPPDPAPKVEIVKAWGPLNQDKRLDVKGELVALRGLCWDPEEPQLWFNFGSYYANGANNPVLGCATLTEKGLTVYGPWKVPEAVHSDIVKGVLFPTPPELKKITGQKLLAFGIKGSTAQKQSWGTGLVSLVAPKLNLPAQAEFHAAPIIHWPMVPNKISPYSNFPRLPRDDAIIIVGNGQTGRTIRGKAQAGSEKTMTLETTVDFKPDGKSPRQPLAGCYLTNQATHEQLEISAWDNKTKVATVRSPWKNGPPAKGTEYEVYFPSYERNQFEPTRGRYQAFDGLTSATWITLPDKHGLLYFGTVAIGYCWYGNQGSHSDPTPYGKKYDNNLKSLLNPKLPVHSSFEGRGGHAEAYVPRWYLVDPQQVVSLAERLAKGMASPDEMQVSWKLAGDVGTLGGDVQLASPKFGQMHWNPQTRRLTVLVMPAGDNSPCELHVWEVGG